MPKTPKTKRRVSKDSVDNTVKRLREKDHGGYPNDGKVWKAEDLDRLRRDYLFYGLPFEPDLHQNFGRPFKGLCMAVYKMARHYDKGVFRVYQPEKVFCRAGRPDWTDREKAVLAVWLLEGQHSPLVYIAAVLGRTEAEVETFINQTACGLDGKNKVRRFRLDGSPDDTQLPPTTDKQARALAGQKLKHYYHEHLNAR